MFFDTPDYHIMGSASDTLADFNKIRQFSHVSEHEKQIFVDEWFGTSATGFRWLWDSVRKFLIRHGYSCDTCRKVVSCEGIDERNMMWGAKNILENLDGGVRLILCERCDRRYRSFGRRMAECDARALSDINREKVNLAFVCSEIRKAYREGGRHVQ